MSNSVSYVSSLGPIAIGGKVYVKTAMGTYMATITDADLDSGLIKVSIPLPGCKINEWVNIRPWNNGAKSKKEQSKPQEVIHKKYNPEPQDKVTADNRFEVFAATVSKDKVGSFKVLIQKYKNSKIEEVPRRFKSRTKAEEWIATTVSVKAE